MKKPKNIERLVKAIYSIDQTNIGPEEAEVLLQRCVDRMLTEEEARSQFPQLFRYFNDHPSELAVYQLALELARADAKHEITESTHVPTRPDKRQSGFQKTIQAAAALGGFHLRKPALGSVRGSQAMFEPVEVSLNDGVLCLEFDLSRTEAQAETWDLAISVSLANELAAMPLEFIPVWLAPESGGAACEVALDEFGGAIFSAVPSGAYTFEIVVNGQVYQIQGIMLPNFH